LNINYLIQKINSDERFDFDEARDLFNNVSLLDLQKAADHARQKRIGNEVYFIVNKHAYYSNICVWQCKFCTFSKQFNDSSAYIKTPEDILLEIEAAPFISEVRITGGVNPKISVDYFCKTFSLIKSALPDIHIEALAPTEIDYLAKLEKLSVNEVLAKLKAAGLGSLAAGGAEIASDRVREQLCPKKSPFSTWSEVSKQAHDMGIMSNASILYGHIETIEERIEHIFLIRELQDQTGGFNAFIPLKYIENPAHGIKSSVTSIDEDLRMFAVSRLLLDNFKHIKVLWLFNGKEFAKKALDFGANDIGGTVYEQQKGVARAAGSPAKESVIKDDMVEMILSSNREPVERGRLYERKEA